MGALFRLAPEMVECTSIRRASVEADAQPLPTILEDPGFPRRSSSLRAQPLLRSRLSVSQRRPPQPVPDPAAAQVRDHLRNQCCEKVLPLSPPCCSASGRSSATSPAVHRYPPAYLPTPG